LNSTIYAFVNITSTGQMTAIINICIRR